MINNKLSPKKKNKIEQNKHKTKKKKDWAVGVLTSWAVMCWLKKKEAEEVNKMRGLLKKGGDGWWGDYEVRRG